MLRRVVVLFLFCLPSILYGWGNDVLIEVLRRSNDEYPVCFDVVNISDNLVFASIGSNYQSGNCRFDFYKSSLPDLNWEYLRSVTGYGRGLLAGNLDYFADTVYLLILNDNNTLEHLKLNPYTGTTIGSGWINYSDSTTSAILKVGTRDGHPRLYVCTIISGPNYDTIKVFRDIGSGFAQVYKDYISASSYRRTVKDVDITTKGDTVVVLMVYERLNTLTSDIGIYYYSFKDAPDNTFTVWHQGYMIANTSDNEVNPTISALDSVVICMYEVNNDIKYAYSLNYLEGFGINDFPYNTPDSIEWAPKVRKWYAAGSRGFDILYTYGYNLYYVELHYISSTGGLSWGTPILLSNQTQPGYYILRQRADLFYPRLENRRGYGLPVALWARDFWHLSLPLFIYDSTYILSDHYTAVRIRESGETGTSFSYSINTFVVENVRISFSKPIISDIEGSVISVDGKVVKEFIIPAGTKEYPLPVMVLKKGLYFVGLKVNGRMFVKRFIIN
ncbi:MAG: hypothetical protein ABIM42_08275 [candidate division WOR-3 bacterium]